MVTLLLSAAIICNCITSFTLLRRISKAEDEIEHQYLDKRILDSDIFLLISHVQLLEAKEDRRSKKEKGQIDERL